MLGFASAEDLFISTEKQKLSPETVARLYGDSPSVSVSALERFASCPFRFFVERGLKVRERDELQLDVREQGSFQHAVLARFHEEATKNGREWRHLGPGEARALIAEIADDEIQAFRDGLLIANEQNRFTAENYKTNLQDFVEAAIRWFETNQFDPKLVEFAFGPGSELPGWRINLSNGKSILIQGRVDRIDVHRDANGESLCLIVDYKSGVKEPNRTLMYHGVQQQLTAYLIAVTEIAEIAALLGVKDLTPAGCFYVPLSARYETAKTRRDISPDKQTAQVAGYTHNGIFNHDYLMNLDSGARAGKKGQFKYWLTKNLKAHGNGINALDREKFEAQLDRSRSLIRDIGERIFEGDIEVYPYKGSGSIACSTCHMQPICRFDSWTQSYNRLTPPPKPQT
jgi:ATP-dependent helicase/nuclease subunit B